MTVQELIEKLQRCNPTAEVGDFIGDPLIVVVAASEPDLVFLAEDADAVWVDDAEEI